MTYIGIVGKGGAVILPPEAHLPEGAKVKVEVVDADAAADDFTDRLLEIAKTIHGLPPDLAKNHDHYIHGAPKQ